MSLKYIWLAHEAGLEQAFGDIELPGGYFPPQLRFLRGRPGQPLRHLWFSPPKNLIISIHHWYICSYLALIFTTIKSGGVQG